MATIDTTHTNRDLVTKETISDITPIAGADSIEVVTVRGWHVVTRIGEFRSGAPCVYFEIDSMVPLDDARFACLAPRGIKSEGGKLYHRVKTARLRGVYSQGLVMPAATFPELDASHDDLARRLGVIKYEPPAVLAGGDIAGVFPEYLGRKTDSERAQNLVDVWDKIRSAGPWIATEKIDGTSMSVFRDRSGTIRVCGRNYEIAEGHNLYWDTVRQYGIDEWLPVGTGVQCEVFGEDIQKNPLRVNGVRIGVFNFLMNGVPFGRLYWPEPAFVLAVPELDLVLPSTVDEALAQVERLDSLVTPGRPAEGVVWHQTHGHGLDVLNGRSTFKVISNRYLTKES